MDPKISVIMGFSVIYLKTENRDKIDDSRDWRKSTLAADIPSPLSARLCPEEVTTKYVDVSIFEAEMLVLRSSK